MPNERRHVDFVEFRRDTCYDCEGMCTAKRIEDCMTTYKASQEEKKYIKK